MDNLQTPQSAETKKYLEEECGLRPWKPTREPNYANPDKMECKWIVYVVDIFDFFLRSHIQRWYFGRILCRSAICSLDWPAYDPLHFLHLARTCLLLFVGAPQGETIQFHFRRAEDFRVEFGVLSDYETCLEQSFGGVRRFRKQIVILTDR